MISSVSLSPVTNTRIVAQFAARPYYFVSTKGNTALISRLDTAMEEINQAEPKLQDNLYDTYFRTIDDTFLLTAEQEAALQAVGTFQVLCVDHDAPYVSQIDGKPTGMLISILDAFAQNAGVEMAYTFCEDRTQARELLETGNFDLVALLLFLVWNRYAKQKAAMQRLHNSQLQEALQIAREANESKSEFLSRMSHDIRTPMNGIVGMLDIADKNVENPDMVRRCHRKIQIAAEYLLSLINDVLDMSKLEAKNAQLHEESVDLHAVVDSCRKIMENRAVEAFAAFPAGSFDYILTDVMMPVMDGYEACRAIRAMERADAAAIPIVAMTANAFSEDIRRSLDAGMNAHISKPFDVNKLKQSLAKL